MTEMTRAGSNISLQGRLTVDTVSGLYNQAPTLGQGDFKVNLSGVEEMDSAGLALLVHWQQQSVKQDSRLYLVDPPEQVSTMIRISNLEALLEQG